MKRFFDTSALAKRYVNESGSKRIAEILRNTSQLAVSILAITEMISALNRLRRSNKLKENYQEIKDSFLTEIEDFVVWEIDYEVIGITNQLLEKTRGKSLDALHLGCALKATPDQFVTADQRQHQMADPTDLNSILIQ